ncbi:RBBP9/YdeN family alpha/beta hydrolase [Pararhizobium sp. LjRoot238]|uniref:RBBP9/YdeN family alpha/beta hydrolase n=1 Tax=Pararhizobium sp. LjRoot238 TaxID=3342293 RepID=UPI003ED04509
MSDRSTLPFETLILPGLNGSGEGHWQRYWAFDDPKAVVLEQANWSCPDLNDWRSGLEQALRASNGVWLVAHSLGCILAANLASSPLADKVRGALLVAPCDLETTERLHPCVLNFGRMPKQSLPFPSLIVGSLNDPYMPFGNLQRVAGHWGSDLIDIGEAGHINVASGFGRWTAGYALLNVLENAVFRRSGIGTSRLDSIAYRVERSEMVQSQKQKASQ